jgi:hypothetical protein
MDLDSVVIEQPGSADYSEQLVNNSMMLAAAQGG